MNAGEAAVIRWEWLAFAQLDCRRLHAVLAARAAVFVVEQNCVYQDIDGLDEQAWHLMGWHRDATLAAYLRVLPPLSLISAKLFSMPQPLARFTAAVLSRGSMPRRRRRSG